MAEWTYKTYAGRSGLPGLEETCYEQERLLSREEDTYSGLGDEYDDEADMTEYLPRTRKHHNNSLDILARAGDGGYLPKEC